MNRFSRAQQIITIALVALCGLSLGARAAGANPFDQTVAPLQTGDHLPPGAFFDQDGRRFSFSQLGTATTLLAFVYTRCTDACPVITHKVEAVRAQLGAGPYRYVEVSIDPARDTVRALKAYATANHLAAPGWLILTGSASTVSGLCRAAGVSVIDNGKGELVHNDRLIIIAPGGAIAD
ncbi:MAG: SCO family protein, partial [Candidatus Eremiobacteraeota bacterium]|nr:SCO family protein [Candidatus Eremiobacteraeota bacterium]